MNLIPLQRIGYGSQFNNLYRIDDTKIRKESKNEYGHFKISKEIAFFQHIMNHHLSFPIPMIHEIGNTYYVMEYLQNYVPLYQYITTISHEKRISMISRIYQELTMLHSSTRKQTTKEEILRLLQMETRDKIVQRYDEIKSLLAPYASIIQKVNNVPLQSFESIMDRIQLKVKEFMDSLEKAELCVIHGDCQFNNILYNPNTDDIVFIDPRGYFGTENVYGMSEYDMAKVRFALSGYDDFDNSDISTLTITDDNLTIPNMFLVDDVSFDDFIGVLTISIWLGNAHCFKNHIPKAVYSFYYALYLGTLYL
jgi:hypothetical protein